jgi:hypothetical protein
MELMVKVKHKRYFARAEARRAECKAKGNPDDSYSNRQLKEAARTWIKATRNKGRDHQEGGNEACEEQE